MKRVLSVEAASGLCLLAACTGDRPSFADIALSGSEFADAAVSSTPSSTSATDAFSSDTSPDGTATTDTTADTSPDDTDTSPDGTGTSPDDTGECTAKQSEACGACGMRLCDSEALEWGPCVGDGRVETCWETEAGDPLPEAAAGVGNCSLGERACSEDGEWSTCVGAIAPVAADDCSVSGDDGNCNGSANEGCECESGVSRDCGSGVGNCEVGSQTCNAAGTWGECVNQVIAEPADSCELEGDDANCNDQVNEGCECTADAPESCNDALACTDEVCSAGACSNPVKAGFCLIDGKCYGPNQTQPGNICNMCTPELNQDAWSAAASNTVDPSNPCQVCSGGSLVANTGANCGASSTECSAQDTCDSQAVCQPNHKSNGSECSDGECNAGECEPLPFDCIAPNPPIVEQPSNVFVFEDGAPPKGQGGTVRDGVYTHTRFDVYGASFASHVPVRTYEVRSQYVQMGVRDWTGSFFAINEIQFAGSFTTLNNALTWDVQNCDPQQTLTVPSLEYTATANGLVTIETLSSGVIIVTTFARN